MLKRKKKKKKNLEDTYKNVSSPKTVPDQSGSKGQDHQCTGLSVRASGHDLWHSCIYIWARRPNASHRNQD